ncbi:MAG: hypothetical protein V1489_00480 [Candidatus Liptonbacteria bacterium]
MKRNDIVGGDLESHENGIVYRGPIESVDEQDGCISFRVVWKARCLCGMWVKHEPNVPICINKRIVFPVDIGGGRIHFAIPHVGSATIFPRGGNKLDPAKVRGLSPSERGA